MFDIWERGRYVIFEGALCEFRRVMRVGEGRGRVYEGVFHGVVCVFACAWISRCLSAPSPSFIASVLS